MPIMSVIKNTSMGNSLCSKVSYEDFNIGSQLIVAEYEEALFMKDGVIEDQGSRRHVLQETDNAYTRKLMDAVPSLGGKRYV